MEFFDAFVAEMRLATACASMAYGKCDKAMRVLRDTVDELSIASESDIDPASRTKVLRDMRLAVVYIGAGRLTDALRCIERARTLVGGDF